MMAIPAPGTIARTWVSLLSTVVKPVHPEGYRFIAGFAVATRAALAGRRRRSAWLGLVLTVWCYYFFRDPRAPCRRARGWW